MKTNGVLMAVSSLPGEYGIGDFGEGVIQFIDYLKEAGIKIWQILPLNPLGSGNSPYQSECSFAIDPIYIDLDALSSEGLILSFELPDNVSTDHVNYAEVRKIKNKILMDAFLNDERRNSKALLDFVKDNKWLDAYAKYSILKSKNGFKPWFKWNDEDKNAYYHEFELKEEKVIYDFICWEHFIAYKQFQKVKKYANSRGVKIFGDLPFYVGTDSSDVWANQDEFQFDSDGDPLGVAGCPPDYFSKDGQRWGNYLYDWDYMKDDGYTFWLSRFKKAQELFDITRIDHFRAFDTYYSINPECPTAVDGVWKNGPGSNFLDVLFKKMPNINIVAEDLGYLAPSVHVLRDKYNLMGMNVFQFTIFDKTFLTRVNQVIYTGTHDNQTLKGWLKSLNGKDTELLNILFARDNIKGRNLRDKVFNYIMGSPCEMAIIPIQDYLNLDDKARMNTPGTSNWDINWTFKLKDYSAFADKIDKIAALIKKYKR